MKRSNRLLILVGVLLAFTGAIGAMVIASGGSSNGTGPQAASPSVTPEPKVQVVVAAKDISAGSQITSDMLTTSQQNVSVVTAAGDTFRDPVAITGRITSSAIKKGQIVVGSRDLLVPGSMTDGQSISASVASGMVAVTMEVDQINGVGTLLVPGDHVDIVLSIWISQVKLSQADMTGQSGKKWQVEIEGGKDVTTKLVIQNRKIITVLTKAPTEENQPAPAPNSTATPKPTDNSVHLTEDHMIVIVEVTPQEAEVIRWAQREEKADPQNYITLGLALRSKDDNDAANVNTQGVTLRVLVEKWGVIAPDPTAVLPKGLAELFKW